MKSLELTLCGMTAKHPDMQGKQSHRMRRGLRAAILLTGSSVLSGCITVNAPSEPIVIELNINIRQEVIYRLAEDVRENIEENADIF